MELALGARLPRAMSLRLGRGRRHGSLVVLRATELVRVAGHVWWTGSGDLGDQRRRHQTDDEESSAHTVG
jgi:hypothetical protein